MDNRRLGRVGRFEYSRDEEDVWMGRVPEDTDVLVTHMPSRFHLDVAGFWDEDLVKELWRTRPQVHVFGHVHGGWGGDVLVYDWFEEWYEDMWRGEGGGLTLLEMGFGYLVLRWWPRCTRGTVLVNAAAGGGLRDTERRNATLISIQIFVEITRSLAMIFSRSFLFALLHDLRKNTADVRVRVTSFPESKITYVFRNRDAR